MRNPFFSLTLPFFFALTMLVVLVAALPSSASAQQSSDERARLHFEAGRSYYDEGNYARALDEFQRAYDLSQRPQLHFNLYLTNERLGELSLAIAHLEAFLETNPADSELLRARLDNLRARLAVQEAERAHDTAAREDAERRAAEAEERARAAEEAAASARGDDDGGPSIHPGAIAGYAVGGAGLVTFGVMGGLVLAHDDDFSRGCLGAGTCTSAALDRQDRRALVADISLGVGIAGAVTGLVLHLVTRDSGDDAASTAISLAPMVGRNGHGLRLVGRF